MYDLGLLAMERDGRRARSRNGRPSRAPFSGMFVNAYMWSLGVLIAGGTANIQRNVIGERGLGMPRDTAAKR
jgi:hypothetical protein